MDTRKLISLVTCAALLWNLSACNGDGSPDAPAVNEPETHSATEDAAKGIRAWQHERDQAVHTSLISPFTAIAAYHLQSGTSARIGADDSGAEQDPKRKMPSMAAVTYKDGLFQVAPVPGSDPPSIHLRDAKGEPSPEGTPVTALMSMPKNALLSLGRFYLLTAGQSDLGRVMVFDPRSARKNSFKGYKWFPPATALQVEAAYRPNPQPDAVNVLTSRGLTKTYYRGAFLDFALNGAPHTLVAFTDRAVPQPGDILFIAFRDATTGQETYPVGRYLEIEFKPGQRSYRLDFNQATNPLCNYSPHYNCPVPLEENTLPVAIRAGEMSYPVEH